jgi:AraC family transcriptional regulator
MDHRAALKGLLCHDRSWQEASPIMSVACWTAANHGTFEAIRDVIEIFIPDDHAVLEMVLPPPDGRQYAALVRGPYISIVPPNWPHSIKWKQHSEIVVLALDHTYFRDKIRSALGHEAPTIGLHCAVIDPFIRELGNTMRNEFRMLRQPGTVYLESLAGVLAIYLGTNYDGNAKHQSLWSGLPAHKLNRVRGFVKEHLADAITVNQLAATVQLSPCHFARMFRQAAGQPPHIYITSQRMERAKDLLRNTDLPLVDVAASVGFQTQAHFTSVFRRHAGLTPRVFRLNWRFDALPNIEPDKSRRRNFDARQ